MKKALLILLVVALCIAPMMTGCSGGTTTNEPSQSAAGESASAAGSEPSTEASAEDMPTAVVIPKLIGIPYFDDSYIGLMQGAEDFGVDVIWDGPTEASATEQAKMVEDYLAQDVDAILLCPNDAKALETTMQKVKDEGVLSINWDSNFDNSITDYCIVSVDSKAYGEMLFESMASSMGGTGEYVILTSNLEVADHNAWIEAGTAYIEANYPDMTLLTDPVPKNEDQQQAYSRTLELLNTYPDLAGIACVSSVNAPGAAQAIREQSMQDQVSIVGTSLPSQVADYFTDGAVDAAVLWRPANVTYVSMYVVRKAWEGAQIVDGEQIPGYEFALKVTDGNIITPCDPLVFTVDNYQDYNF